MNRLSFTVGAALLAAAALAQEPASQSPSGAEVYFIAPRDGAKIHGPVTVQFGLKGMGVAPAGIKFDNTGHHHLLVDVNPGELALDKPLPASDHVVHFGKGQTETTLNLPPGKHTLELVFADFQHLSFNPPLQSKKITITVD
ncbi:MAG TPA: DUF4399 domain-containing protein [Steroidobacteraceae bacterium]|jgi:hypothetical protein|nr:DUF4399 domain-containing protein [Steroidobacteraceae bacterium]